MLDWFDSPELERWTISDQIGQGGMGLVYAAHDRRDGQPRAIKVIRPDLATGDPQARDLFLREMRIAGALRHENVVRTDAIGVAGGAFYIVMELCALGSLADAVARTGPLQPVEAVDLFLPVLDGLQYAHHAPLPAAEGQPSMPLANGVVHRDIKPQNILLAEAPGGRQIAKLADFGLAKAYETAGLSGITQTGTAAGTPAFMSREQVLNFKYARPDVDVWAVAASLYHALTGTAPRDFTRGRDPWLTVCEDAPVPILRRNPALPHGLAQVIDTALEDDDRPRFATASELRDAISDVQPLASH